MIMNHRTRFDWLYLFSYQVRHASVRRYTISLKNGLKFLPGIGEYEISHIKIYLGGLGSAGRS